MMDIKDKLLQNDIDRFNKVERLTHLGSYAIDLKTGQTVWSDELFRIFGFLPGSMKPTGDSRIELAHPDDQKLIKESIEKALREKSEVKFESRLIRPDGSVRWVLSMGYVEFDETDEPKSFIGSLLDITDKKLLENSLLEETEKLKITIASIGDGVIATDTEGRITMINAMAEKLTGFSQEEAFGKPVDAIFNIFNEMTGLKSENPIRKVLKTGMVIGLANHTALRSKSGQVRSIADSAAPIKDNDGNIHGVILVFRDVTEEKLRQDEICYMSYHDALTNLYNRRFFEEELLRVDLERNLPVSIIMGDMNGLKLTNDAFGHGKGDELLRNVAAILKNSCRADEIIARWGGDEFIILLPKTGRAQAAEIVTRIKENSAHAKVDSIDISISFGWDTKENAHEDILQTLKNAEDFMYKHKMVESESTRGNAITTIIHALHEKNPREEQHSKRVSELSQALGRAMELSEMDVNKLKVIGLLHDIGKIAIEENILNKPGKLTETERDEINKHPEIGYRILSSSSEMAEIAQCALFHHEQFGGAGYPRGLKGEEIPLLSRIIAVADSYDAMTSERAYRKALGMDIAVGELTKNKGTQFDPSIVDVFIDKVLNAGFQRSESAVN